MLLLYGFKKFLNIVIFWAAFHIKTISDKMNSFTFFKSVFTEKKIFAYWVILLLKWSE